MQESGYYALPFASLPRDVSQNINQMTLFSKPSDRLIRIANDILISNPTISPNQLKNKFEVKLLFVNGNKKKLTITNHTLRSNIITNHSDS